MQQQQGNSIKMQMGGLSAKATTSRCSWTGCLQRQQYQDAVSWVVCKGNNIKMQFDGLFAKATTSRRNLLGCVHWVVWNGNKYQDAVCWLCAMALTSRCRLVGCVQWQQHQDACMTGLWKRNAAVYMPFDGWSTYYTNFMTISVRVYRQRSACLLFSVLM